MAKNLELNGMIHSKYKSEAAMADAMGWSRQRLSVITNMKKIPDIFEIEKMADVLDEPFMDVCNIFLENKSTLLTEAK